MCRYTSCVHVWNKGRKTSITKEQFLSEEEEELDKFGEEEFNDDWKFAFEKLAQQISDQVEVFILVSL